MKKYRKNLIFLDTFILKTIRKNIYAAFLCSLFMTPFPSFALKDPPPGFTTLCLLKDRTARLSSEGILNANNYQQIDEVYLINYRCPENYDAPAFFKASTEKGNPTHKCSTNAGKDQFRCIEDFIAHPETTSPKITSCLGTANPYIGCAHEAEKVSTPIKSKEAASPANAATTQIKKLPPVIVFKKEAAPKAASFLEKSRTPTLPPAIPRSSTSVSPKKLPTPESFKSAVEYLFLRAGKSLDETFYQEKMAEFHLLAMNEQVKKKAPNMTLFDFYAVYVYTTLANSYQTINAAFRFNHAEVLGKIKPVTTYLDHYLENAAALGTFIPSGTRKLSRFLTFPEDSREYTQYAIGALISDLSYASATASPEKMQEADNSILKESNVHLLIRPMRHIFTNGIPLFDSVTKFADSESEVLFKRRTYFKVTKRTPPGEASLCSRITSQVHRMCVELDEI